MYVRSRSVCFPSLPAFAVILMLILPGAAVAMELSAHLGYHSQYIFRGVPQKTSSPFVGVDLEAGGLFLGAWAGDVGDGAEVDYFGGYRFSAGAVDLWAGATVYAYTGDFDDDYREVSFGLDWKFLGLHLAAGQYDNFAGPRLDYSFVSMSARFQGLYLTLGRFGHDFDGHYTEAGYQGALQVEGSEWFDWGLALVQGGNALLGGERELNIALTIRRTIDF